MHHLPFTTICRIADGDVAQDELVTYMDHVRDCRTCQQEIELQKSMVRISHEARLAQPSVDFTQNVLDTINPSRQRRWYVWMLHNLGNIIAMVSVLTFLGYVFSQTETPSIQNEQSVKTNPIMDSFKFLQDGSHQVGQYLLSKIKIQGMNTSHPYTIYFALLAIIILVFIDRIATHFFRHYKLNQ